MDKTIYKIRKKFIIMATIISFCIISMMVITLNLLMNLNYKDENKLVTDIISQTALVNTPSIDTEIFYFKDLSSMEVYLLKIRLYLGIVVVVA